MTAKQFHNIQTNSKKEFLYNGKVIDHAVVCGEIVHVSQEHDTTEYILDDSTGLIVVKYYNQENSVPTLAKGDYVKAIGKIRNGSDEKHVFADCRNQVSMDEYFVHLIDCGYAYVYYTN
ncbi:OB domain-containing protein [Entamoeba marina]